MDINKAIKVAELAGYTHNVEDRCWRFSGGTVPDCDPMYVELFSGNRHVVGLACARLTARDPKFTERFHRRVAVVVYLHPYLNTMLIGSVSAHHFLLATDEQLVDALLVVAAEMDGNNGN